MKTFPVLILGLLFLSLVGGLPPQSDAGDLAALKGEFSAPIGKNTLVPLQALILG